MCECCVLYFIYYVFRDVFIIEFVEFFICIFYFLFFFFFFQAEDGIRDHCVTGVQTCALPICSIGGEANYLGLFATHGTAPCCRGSDWFCDRNQILAAAHERIRAATVWRDRKSVV